MVYAVVFFTGISIYSKVSVSSSASQLLFVISSELQQASSPEQEEGFIPDSPVLPSSLPVVNKLKKRRNADKMKRVRYVEMPLGRCNNSLFNGQSALF